jgi:hypothetical protein
LDRRFVEKQVCEAFVMKETGCGLYQADGQSEAHTGFKLSYDRVTMRDCGARPFVGHLSAQPMCALRMRRKPGFVGFGWAIYV